MLGSLHGTLPGTLVTLLCWTDLNKTGWMLLAAHTKQMHAQIELGGE
jgi:hypothetical protein